MKKFNLLVKPTDIGGFLEKSYQMSTELVFSIGNVTEESVYEMNKFGIDVDAEYSRVISNEFEKSLFSMISKNSRTTSSVTVRKSQLDLQILSGYKSLIVSPGMSNMFSDISDPKMPEFNNLFPFCHNQNSVDNQSLLYLSGTVGWHKVYVDSRLDWSNNVIKCFDRSPLEYEIRNVRTSYDKDSESLKCYVEVDYTHKDAEVMEIYVTDLVQKIC